MTYIPDELRRLVYERAGGRCEYCLLHQHFVVKRHSIDHIYAEKHGGETIVVNLCLSCIECNLYKGSDLCSLDPATGEIVRLFHPRRDVWSEHFRLDGALIAPLTPVGRVTVRLLRFNDVERVEEREALMKLGRYPM